ESWVDPLVILVSVPFAVTGAFLALLATGTSLSVTSFLGVVILIGVVVNNAIVLVDAIKQLELDGMPTGQAIRTAGRRRLRPVLITTLTTTGGMIPLAVASGVGAELWTPMGRTALGGLVVSTLVTLVLLPVVYDLVTRLQRRTRELRGPHTETTEG
ncbi:MAG: efflux RND transporter permease subunit, partial [Myxococcota bacterium]